MLRPFVKFMMTGLVLMMANTTFAQDIWIDVRTAEEFNAGHLEGSINIPHEEIAVRISEVTNDQNATIRLYCRSGNRSGIAQQTLQSIGFTKVTNEGGYEELLRKQGRQ